ncbi:MAG TPA: inositol monophosphatase family protein [Solirubrobacteraceae bacterium]|nr:inositol monophosphatase family protein [Solirubrobacteraceae bacterium]
MLAAAPTTSERAVVVGEGAGGDRTLAIDQAAEEVVFEELDRLHALGTRFVAVSEERGEVDFGGGPLRVVIDPIDGSMNAKRGLAPYAVSIAVADGETMADVTFGFVADLASGEQWHATLGGGARLGEIPLVGPPAERRGRDGRLELVCVESAYPARLGDRGPAIAAVAHRVRMIGSMALALCQLAGGRVDGMAALWRCRAVDVAAAQLIVRESGGVVAFTAFDDPLGAPLDVISHSPIVAARTATALAELATLPSSLQ